MAGVEAAVRGRQCWWHHRVASPASSCFSSVRLRRNVTRRSLFSTGTSKVKSNRIASAAPFRLMVRWVATTAARRSGGDARGRRGRRRTPSSPRPSSPPPSKSTTSSTTSSRRLIVRPERLAKRIARCGIASRRAAERLIKDGKVKVDGKIITTPVFNVEQHHLITVRPPGFHQFGLSGHSPPPPATSDLTLAAAHMCYPNDRQVNGKSLNADPPKLFMQYKPRKVLVQHVPDEAGRPVLFEVLRKMGLPDHLIPVGRLDFMSEGLLLLTNDGVLARNLTDPRTGFEFERVYRVRAHGMLTQEKIDRIVRGVKVGRDFLKAEKVELEATGQDSRHELSHNQWMRITLCQGKNNEIRRLLSALNLSVNRLIRVRFGPFVLKDLEKGEVLEIDIPQSMQNLVNPSWRFMSKKEAKAHGHVDVDAPVGGWLLQSTKTNREAV